MIESNISAQPRPELTPARKGLVGKRLRHALKAAGVSATIPRRLDSPTAPLSFAQQRLWFIDQLEPRSPAYHVATALRLTGNVHIHALERSLNSIINRHEILRTRFPAIDGTPVQLVEPVQLLELPLVELSQLPESEREHRARQHLKEASQEPFNLATGPLIRAMLVRIREHDHFLLVVMHHIASDGWSLGVLFHELELSYRAIVQQRSAALPELRIQYADYAQWQQQTITAQNLEEPLRWWKERLEHPPASLSLPPAQDPPEPLSFLRGDPY